jgi:hypothetical protein
MADHWTPREDPETAAFDRALWTYVNRPERNPKPPPKFWTKQTIGGVLILAFLVYLAVGVVYALGWMGAWMVTMVALICMTGRRS